MQSPPIAATSVAPPNLTSDEGAAARSPSAADKPNAPPVLCLDEGEAAPQLTAAAKSNVPLSSSSMRGRQRGSCLPRPNPPPPFVLVLCEGRVTRSPLATAKSLASPRPCARRGGGLAVAFRHGHVRRHPLSSCLAWGAAARSPTAAAKPVAPPPRPRTHRGGGRAAAHSHSRVQRFLSSPSTRGRPRSRRPLMPRPPGPPS